MGSVLSSLKKADDKVVLITGCTEGGIGHALAVEYAKRGSKVYATSRRKATMTGLDQYDNIDLLELDVTKPDTIKAAVDTIIAKSGKIDILMNNAGIGVLGPVAEAPLDAYRKVWETNVGGVISVSQAVFPHMADRGSGMIINVSSLAGRTPLPLWGTYCSSKSALDTVTDCMRMEMKPFGVHVAIAPIAFTTTPIYSHVRDDADTCFPATGRYRAWFDQAMADVSTMVSREAITPQQTALQLVDASLASWPKWHIFVNRPFHMIIMSFLPTFLQDMILMHTYWPIIRKQQQAKKLN